MAARILRLLALLALTHGCAGPAQHHDRSLPHAQAEKERDTGPANAFRATDGDRFRARLGIDGGALKMGSNGLTLEIQDGAGGPVAGAAIQLAPWMPLHGHGTAVAPAVRETEPGVYRLEGVELPMPGVWELRFEIVAGPLRDSVVFGYFQATP